VQGNPEVFHVNRRYILICALIQIGIFGFSIQLHPASAQQTFEGTESITTEMFECGGICRITWTAEYENPTGAIFSGFVMQVDKGLLDSFSGLAGETYLYQTGTFYFKVTAVNLKTWEIQVEPLESAELSSYFTGTGSQVTAPFNCEGICRMTWTVEVEDPTWARFSAIIWQVDVGSLLEAFSGFTGESYLYQTGTFYFKVNVADLKVWEIRVEPLESVEPRTYFNGIGGRITVPFTCTEACTITWVTQVEDPTGVLFSATIQRRADGVPQDSCTGPNGTLQFSTAGTFYFQVVTNNVDAWAISTDAEKPATIAIVTTAVISTLEPMTVSQTTPPASLPVTETTSMATTTKPPVSEFPLRTVWGALVLGILGSAFTRRRTSRK
jgi:hypothetical protein